MATTDPFTKGGGTSSGSGGAIPQNAPVPVIGPRTKAGWGVVAGKGPYGGRTNPATTRTQPGGAAIPTGIPDFMRGTGGGAE